MSLRNDDDYRKLVSRIGGLSAARSRYEKKADRYSGIADFYRSIASPTYAATFEELADAQRSKARFQDAKVADAYEDLSDRRDELEKGGVEPVAIYDVYEYVKYYKYLAEARDYRSREFEARSYFTIRKGLDPTSDNNMRVVETLLDNVMSRLGIQITGDWEEGWTVGGEKTGTETIEFLSDTEVVVEDKIRNYVYSSYRGYNCSISVREKDFS